jgi:hypothetical protein
MYLSGALPLFAIGYKPPKFQIAIILSLNPSGLCKRCGCPSHEESLFLYIFSSSIFTEFTAIFSWSPSLEKHIRMSASDNISSSPPWPATFTPPPSCDSAPWTYVDFGGDGPSTDANLTSTITLYRPNEFAGLQLSTNGVTKSFDIEACLGPLEDGSSYHTGVCPFGQTTATAVDTAGTAIAVCCPT